jgi:hypothetical protein
MSFKRTLSPGVLSRQLHAAIIMDVNLTRRLLMRVQQLEEDQVREEVKLKAKEQAAAKAVRLFFVHFRHSSKSIFSLVNLQVNCLMILMVR